jgi:hypothetical protein
MIAATLAAQLHQIILVHGPDVEILAMDAATGERGEFHLSPAIATFPQASGLTKAQVYFALTPIGQEAKERG